MSEEQNYLPDIQQFIEQHYGELSFATSNAFLTTKDPVEIDIEGKKKRYFIPETVIDLKGPTDSENLIFNVGGIGRASAVADKIYLTFTLADENNNTIHHATTKMPDMNRLSRSKAQEDPNFHSNVFSMSGSIPNFPFSKPGILSMDIEFHLTNPGLIELLDKESGVEGGNGGDPANPAAVFTTELCRVIVRMGSAEEF